MRFPKFLISLTIALAIAFWSSPLGAQNTVVYPNDGDSSLQAALDRAGCGGVLRISAGIYREGLLAPGDPPSTFPTVCHAGVRVIGAGIDRTILVMTLPQPGGRPFIRFGTSPFAPPPVPAPLNRHVELAHMTVLTDPAIAGPASAAIGLVYGDSGHLHDLKIVGFVDGLIVDQSTNATIENVQVMGPGCPPAASGIRGIRFWSHPASTPGILHGGHVIRGVIVSDVCAGVFLRGDLMSTVHHSTTLRTRWGMRATGAGGLNLHHNVIGDSSQSGFLLVSTDNSQIHQNTICSAPVGLDYTPEAAISDFGFGSSSANHFHHNTLIAVGTPVQGTLQSDNTATHNTTAMGPCP